MLKTEPISQVRIKKTAEIIASQIRNAIIRGELGDGNALPAEAQLIAKFQVSRPTIREAIRILESEKLLYVSRGARGGARISLPTSELVSRTLGLTLQSRHVPLDDIYAARAFIEPLAARLAAETRPKEASAILRAHVKQEFQLINDRTQIAKAVCDFHCMLVEQSGNKTLSLLLEVLQDISLKHLSLCHRQNRDSEDIQLKRTRTGFRSHEKLVDLIEAGDGEGAQKHWEKHMQKASEYWLRGFGSQGLDILE
jgi:DNA-binding FadR family transcriptional regulator